MFEVGKRYTFFLSTPDNARAFDGCVEQYDPKTGLLEVADNVDVSTASRRIINVNSGTFIYAHYEA